MRKLLLAFLLSGTVGLSAQIPSGWDPFSVDTLDVPPMYEDGGEWKIALAEYIISDSSAIGERNPDRVYRLERYKDESNPGIYVLDYGMNLDFPLKIVAEEGTGRLPMIVGEYTSDGGVLDYFFNLLGDEQHHVFKNIFFQRVNLDREFNSDWNQGVYFRGNNTKATIEGCVFNAFTGGALVFTGNDNSIFLRDNVWRNGEWPTHPWIGQQCSFGNANHIDTLIFTNNIYFNNNAYALFHKGQVIDHAVVEHNTIMTSAVDAIFLRHLVNANVRSNIFYGYAAYGDTELARTSGSWYEAEGDSLCIISIEKLGRLASTWGKSESERLVNVTNNVYFTPQALKDYYAAHASYTSPKTGETDPVTAPLWMNARTKALFTDKASYPLFNEKENLELDPQFKDTEVDSWVSNAIAQWCTEMRSTSTEQGWGAVSEHRNYDQYLGDDILSGVQWPLPEGKMEITNSQLLTAGHDKLPVGCLNWDPGLRAKYKEPTEIFVAGLNERKGLDFSIYPNPANNILNIASDQQIETIEIVNIVGNKVIALGNTNSGVSTVDISSLLSGVYIVKIFFRGSESARVFVKR